MSRRSRVSMKGRRDRAIRRPEAEFTPQCPWLDLVNSKQWDGFGRPTDHLMNAQWMQRFLAYWTNLPEDLIKTARVADLNRLRNVLRQAAEAIASGQPLQPWSLGALNVALRAPGYLQLVRKQGQIRVELHPSRLDWRWVASRVATSFVDSLDRQRRIKICGNSGCRWAFIDATKGNIRRWCKDSRCGNRDRVRRARARAR
jgi:predicted RNA-binding Zn ribbon-like protein